MCVVLPLLFDFFQLLLQLYSSLCFNYNFRLTPTLVGDTVTGVTGSNGKPAGDALHSLGDGVEGGTNKIARGVEDAGKGKKGW
jgi:hypothetical protein